MNNKGLEGMEVCHAWGGGDVVYDGVWCIMVCGV